METSTRTDNPGTPPLERTRAARTNMSICIRLRLLIGISMWARPAVMFWPWGKSSARIT